MATASQFEKVGECLYRNCSSGSYYALVKVRSKQIKRSLETKNQAEARRKLKDFRRDCERLDPSMGGITLGQLIDKYLESIVHLASGTKAAKEKTCGRFRQHVVGWNEKPISKIKPSDIHAFLATFRGASLHNNSLEVVRSIFDLAVKDGAISRSPVEGVIYRRRSKPIRLAPALAEFRAIVEEIRSQKYADTAEESADYVEFLGLSGLGKAEAGSLRWQDVDLKRGKIIAFRQKTRTGFAVPIFPQLRPLLEKRRAAAVVANGGKLPAPEVKVFGVADAKKALATACARLALPNYSSRAFRRMFITTAIERGVDVKVIAQWQGHRDGGKLILDTYSHVRPAHSDRMAQLMSDSLSENSSNSGEIVAASLS